MLAQDNPHDPPAPEDVGDAASAHVAAPSGRPARRRRGRRPALPIPPRLRPLTSVAAAWLLTVLAHLLHADPAVLLAIVAGAAALSRYGSTLLDRLMAAVVTLAAAGILGGLVISYWPWGLDPVALGGTGLTILIAVSAATGRRFRLPLKVPAPDATSLAAGAAALLIAAWPTLHVSFWQRFRYSALLADRIRQYNMFDVVRTGHGYAFAHFDRVSAIAMPGARSYPSGMQMVYAILDAFVHGDANPGTPIDEFNRYYWYVLISFGLLVLSTAWAARRIAGPLAATVHRLPSVFMTSGIGAFLATGYFLSYVWQGFDSVVFASVFLVLGMAVILRPPTDVVEQSLLAGSAFLAVVYGHPLLLPHIGVTLAVGFVLYRKRFLRRGAFRIALLAGGAVALTAIPLLAIGGFNVDSRFHTDGFIIAAPRHLIIAVAIVALLALANPAARRLPSCRAALATVAILGALHLALEIKYHGNSSTHYYIEKSLNGFILMGLVGTGSLATLWRTNRVRPAASNSPSQPPPTTKPWPVRQAEALMTAVAASLAVGAFAFSPATLNWNGFQPGTDTTWAQLWTGGHTFIASYGREIEQLNDRGILTDGKPTIIASSDSAVLNLNLTLLTGALNRNLHSVSSQVNHAANFTGLVGLPSSGTWPAQTKAGVNALERVLEANPVPVRVVVSDYGMVAVLKYFAAVNTRAHFTVVYVPR